MSIAQKSHDCFRQITRRQRRIRNQHRNPGNAPPVVNPAKAGIQYVALA